MPNLVEVGDAAPQVRLQDDQGNEVTIAAFWRDRSVAFYFLRHLG